MEIEFYKAMFQEEIKKGLEHFERELSKISVGRANPRLVANIRALYYGEATPIEQISSISVPQPQQLLIKPFDISSTKNITAAIVEQNLDLQVVNEGNQIRLTFPQLTTDRRKELVKKVSKISEEGKVAVRLVRQNVLKHIKNDDELTEDEIKKYSEEIQNVTDNYIVKVADITKEKEKDLMTL